LGLGFGAVLHDYYVQVGILPGFGAEELDFFLCEGAAAVSDEGYEDRVVGSGWEVEGAEGGGGGGAD